MNLQSIRDNVAERDDLQFLQTMPELLEFADWVFGPEGLPELDILAYSDFSNRDRQPNILIVPIAGIKADHRWY